jgi:hypothetical protein
MLRFGIYKADQYARMGAERRLCGSQVAFNLLKLPDDPTPEQVRIFEDISFTLRTTNGIFRTTFPGRFRDVDTMTLELLKASPPKSLLLVQDRAVSHALTAWEWADMLFRTVPDTEFIASDIVLFLLDLTISDNERFIVEPDGTPLQYIRPPFVLSLHDEPRRFPLNRLLARLAWRRFELLDLPQGWIENGPGNGYRLTKIPYVHPSAVAFSKQNPRFQLRTQSVFDITPGACDILRTMNILNNSYFSPEQLAQGIEAAHRSLRPGGIWITGRTLEEDFSNHVTFFDRQDTGWKVRRRIGGGAEIESLVLGWRPS